MKVRAQRTSLKGIKLETRIAPTICCLFQRVRPNITLPNVNTVKYRLHYKKDKVNLVEDSSRSRISLRFQRRT